MAITYTNEIKTNVSDPLRSLIYTEFKPIDVVLDGGFDGARMSSGEYIRYFLLSYEEIENHSDGETVNYTFEVVYYFDTKYYREKKAFDEVYSDRFEHLKTLLKNNRSYNDGTYRWHLLAIEGEEIQTVEELEEIEDEQTIALRLVVTITRSNFR